MRLALLVALSLMAAFFPEFERVVAPCFAAETPSDNPLAGQLQGRSCEIFDQIDVSHARAADEMGAIACLGYLHGRDRGWQMDFLRRVAEGRKAEVLGYRALQDDLQMRMLDLDHKAHELFAKMSEKERAPFWAYAFGANLGLATEKAKSSYEFQQLGYQPEAWGPISTLEVLLLQSFDQTQRSFTVKLREESWRKQYGDQARSLFARGGLPWSTTTLKQGEYPVRPQSLPRDEGSVMNAHGLPLIPNWPTEGVGHGSNNWVIAPKRSQTGNAWFANDPHLDLKRPPFWYWAHIEGGKIDVIGASLPGSPIVASGTSRHVSWGLTNSYFDVAELGFVPTSELYDAQVRWPLVWVKMGALKLPFFFIPFQRTRQGWPVLPLTEGVPEGKSLVLRWSGFELESHDFVGIFELLEANSASAADRALSRIGLPSWNFVFADTQGQIGYRVVGRLPKHEQDLPFGVSDRHLNSWAPWTYLNADEAPHVMQPARGYVVTANNQQWPADSWFRDGRAQSASFRAFRIEELLTRTPQHDRSTLQALQCEQQAVDARFILPPLLKVLQMAIERQGGLSPREASVYHALKGWDFNAGLECKPCGVYVRWTQRLKDLENLNDEALFRVATAPPAEPFYSSVIETFREALNDLQIHEQGELKPWGEIHVNYFSHFSGKKSFSVAPISTGGVEHSVNPGSGHFDEKTGQFVHTAGASQRLIVELSNPPSVYAVLAGPNQDVASPNLADPQGPWMKWRRCELERRSFPLDWATVHSSQVRLH